MTWKIWKYFRSPQPDSPTVLNTCTHVWRSIAAPYVQQCRKCGAVNFREDSRGDFPDGLREWVERMTKPNGQRRTDRPGFKVDPVLQLTREDLCHCGASMVRQESVDFGPIWYCEICTSWRRANV